MNVFTAIKQNSFWSAPFLRRNRANPHNLNQRHGDFRPLVTGGGWHSLTSDIRNRFDAMSDHRILTNYTGTMKVERSGIGWLFAQICRLFGSPLAPYAGEDVPVGVNVFPVEGGGICWQRVYDFDNRLPVTVQSIKIVDVKRGLLECVGGGLGMRLKVFEKDKALHFTSDHYFMDIAGYHVPLPLLLTPGALHVEHIDEGDDHFRFRLSFTHPWFGQTFFQDGVFVERET